VNVDYSLAMPARVVVMPVHSYTHIQAFVQLIHYCRAVPRCTHVFNWFCLPSPRRAQKLCPYPA